MHHSSPSNALKTLVQNGGPNNLALLGPFSPKNFHSPDFNSAFSPDNLCNGSAPNSTPRAQLLKAAADNRHALHACTLEDLAHLLEDADSAATNSQVIKLAITLATNEVHERVARAEITAKEAVESAALAKSDAEGALLALKQEQQAVVQALISAQSDAMSSAMEEERALRHRVSQLDKLLIDEREGHALSQSRIQQLETIIEDSAVKMDRLDAVQSRAASLENALREAWDRVRLVETTLRDHQVQLGESNAELFESQTRARTLESTLSISQAVTIATQGTGVREREDYESIIAQLRLDLTLSRESVERARAHTDVMITQLGQAHAENSALVQEHDESKRSILARTNELKVILDSQVAYCMGLHARLKDATAAAMSAESHAAVTDGALAMLRQECSELNASSQSQLLAASKREVDMQKKIERLEGLLQEGITMNASMQVNAAELERKLIEAGANIAHLERALEKSQSEMLAKDSEAANERSTYEAIIQQLKQSNENARQALAADGRVAPMGKSQMQVDAELQSGNSSPACGMDSASASAHSSPADSPRPRTVLHHRETTSSTTAIASSPILSPAADSTTSSPALPLSSPISSPGVLKSHSELASPGDPIRPDAADLAAPCSEIQPSVTASTLDRAKGVHVRRPEAHLVSPTSLSLSPARASKLVHESFQSSPRPYQSQPTSAEVSPRGKSSPAFMQSDTSIDGTNLSTEAAGAMPGTSSEAHHTARSESTLRGTATSANGSKVTWVYHGAVNEQGLPDGQGKRTFSNGEIYEGMWSAGVRNGFGRTQHADGAVYVGEHKDGQKDGQGCCTYSEGSVHKGLYRRGVKSGPGTCTWANGNAFSGMYENDRMHGSGTFKWVSGHVYTGEFANDKRHGRGTLIYADGTRQNGQWYNGSFVAES